MSAFGWSTGYPTQILLCGDSIMAGDTGYQAGAYETPGDYLPGRPRLSQQNVAVPGSQIQNVTNVQIPGATGGYTDIMVISGINNIVTGVTIELMKTYARNLMTYVEGLGGSPRLMMATVMAGGNIGSPAPWTQAMQDVLEEYNEWLPQECVSRGHDCADLWRLTQDPDDYTIRYSPYEADPTHLNQYGAEIVGDCLMRVAAKRFDKQVQVHA